MSLFSGTIAAEGAILAGGTTASTYRLVQSPATISRSTLIATASGDAVYGAAGTAWTLVNYGTVQAGNGNGVDLAAPSAGSDRVVNSGTVAGSAAGVLLHGSAYLDNFGTVTGGTAVYFNAGGTVKETIVNRAAISGTTGVGFSASSEFVTATNAATGTIAGMQTGVALGGFEANLYNYGLISGGSVGVSAGGYLTAIRNFGTIASAGGVGVRLNGSHTLLNTGTISGPTAVSFGGHDLLVEDSAAKLGALAGFDATDTIELYGVFATGISFANGVLTVYGQNKAVGTLALQGSFSSGGFNLGTDPLHGFAVITYGALIRTIGGTYTGEVTLTEPTSITQTGAVIVATGNAVVNQAGSAGTLVNAGTVSAASGQGVSLGSGGIVMNGNPSAGGLIAGAAAGVVIAGGSGSVANYAVITGTRGGVGVLLSAANSTVANTGTIAGGSGVKATSAGDTVANAGTIIGMAGTAVALTDGDRLVVGFGAVFAGLVDGGGGHSVLALAGPSLPPGAIEAPNYGVLRGLASSIVNFGTLQIYPGDVWVLSGYAADVRVTNAGTIVVRNGDTLSLGAVTQPGGATGLMNLANGGTVELAGAVAGAQTVLFSDGTDLLRLDQPGGFAGAITGMQPGDTIDLLGASATGVASYSQGLLKLNDGTTLRLSSASPQTASNFSLTPDNNGGALLSLGPGYVSTMSGYGIVLNQNPTTIGPGQQVTNYGGGNYGAAVLGPSPTAWTVVNSGVVEGAVYGILLQAGGDVVNSGLIGSAYGTGVYLAANGTVTNAGTIAGATAIRFASTGNRLIVDPGAVFSGAVAAPGSSTLELAPGPAIGTLSGLGANYSGFTAVRLDGGANWALSGDLSGARITNDGAIVAQYSDALTLGAVTANSGATGVINIASYGSVVLAKAVDASQTVVFAYGSGMLTIERPKHFMGVITGFQAGDTLYLAHIRATNPNYYGGVLTLTNAAGAQVLQLQVTAYPAGGYFQATSYSGGTLITLAAVPAGYAQQADRLTNSGAVGRDGIVGREFQALAASGGPPQALLVADDRPGAVFAHLPGR